MSDWMRTRPAATTSLRSAGFTAGSAVSATAATRSCAERSASRAAWSGAFDAAQVVGGPTERDDVVGDELARAAGEGRRRAAGGSWPGGRVVAEVQAAEQRRERRAGAAAEAGRRTGTSRDGAGPDAPPGRPLERDRPGGRRVGGVVQGCGVLADRDGRRRRRGSTCAALPRVGEDAVVQRELGAAAWPGRPS